jgi:hypothetical protein
VFVGNEASCDSTSFEDGVRIYDSGYDQCSDWVPQQSFLSALLTGQKIEVGSLVSPLYEIAEMQILHRRYPDIGKYQMSCFVNNEFARESRWCCHCIKCACSFAYACAANVNPRSLGFKKNLFDKKYAGVYQGFYDENPELWQYFSYYELSLGLYLALKNGYKGYAIDFFRQKFSNQFTKIENVYKKTYLKVYPPKSIPDELKTKVMDIYKAELKAYAND